MTALPLLLLIALAVLAVIGAKGAKSKILNIAVILGFMAVGLGIGALLGVWGKNNGLGAEFAVPLAELLGAVGAFGCMRRNKWIEKKNVEGSATGL
jgi:hypothetical protein